MKPAFCAGIVVQLSISRKRGDEELSPSRKPSKFDRARVIPIGDGLGRMLAEIIRHVRRFYNSTAVPICDRWDLHEKRPGPPAPYLLQGLRHPSTAGIQTIRDRIRELSIRAGAQRPTALLSSSPARLPTRFCNLRIAPVGLHDAVRQFDRSPSYFTSRGRLPFRDYCFWFLRSSVGNAGPHEINS
jgi:hypothetical protein